MVLEEPGRITPEGVRGKRYSPLTREMYGATSDGLCSPNDRTT